MKAWHVKDKTETGEEAYNEIVYAETESIAKTKSEAYEMGVDWVNLQCRRASTFDPYYDKDIPIEVYIEDGWHFDCYSCGNFTGDNVVDGNVFCDECLGKDDDES